MIIQTFKSNQRLVLAFLPVLLIALWWHSLVSEIPLELSLNGTPLFDLINNWIQNRVANVLVAIGLIVSSAVLLNNVINNEEIFEKETYLPALLYGLAMSSYIDYHLLHPIILANFFLILALRRLFFIRRAEGAKTMAYDASFFIGISSLFYVPFAIFIFLVFATLAALRPFSWKEYCVAILGWITPLVLFVGTAYVLGNLQNVLNYFEVSSFYEGSFFKASLLKRIVAFILVGVVSIFAAGSFLQKQRISSLRFKRISNVILTYGFMILVVSGVHLLFRKEPPLAFLASVFAAIFVSFYLYYGKRTFISNLVVYTYILFIIVNIYFDNVYNYFN